MTADRPDLAPTAALFADPSRARIVSALVDGRALPASVLADECGIAASTASGHLARLVEGKVLAVESSGRHRYFRLAGPDVVAVVEALSVLAPQPPVRSLRQATRAAAMRRARTCYDHLAGRYGVAVTAALVERDALRRTDGGTGTSRGRDRLAAPVAGAPYVLGDDAGAVLFALGVDVDALLDRPRGSRPLLRFCVDWSEQRHHVAGALGAALLDAFVEQGWLAPRPGGRTVEVTRLGVDALRSRLGVVVTDPPQAVGAAS